MINFKLLIVALTSATLFLFSCSLMEEDEEYSLPKFDQRVAGGLMENIYTADLTTVTFANLVDTVGEDSDADVDSLVEVASFRQSTFTMLDTSNIVITPSVSKYLCKVPINFFNGYSMLEVPSGISADDPLAFYLDSFLELTVWDDSGEKIDYQNNTIDWGIISISPRTKARFEYALDPGDYLMRFRRSEIMVKDTVIEYHLVVLPENAEPSAEGERLCSLLNKSSNSATLQISALAALDTNWVTETIENLYSEDSTRAVLLQKLESQGISIGLDDLDGQVNILKNTDIDEGFLLVDFTGGPANTDYKMVFSDYYELELWAATDSMAVPVTSVGITYDEVGACANIRKIDEFTLGSDKYFLEFAIMSGAENPSNFSIVITE